MYPYFQNPYAFNQFRQPQYQQPMIPQPPGISCEMVGDIETVRAAQLDMTGQPKFYPRSDGSAVYRKQLMPDGTSKIMTYTLTTDNQETPSDGHSDPQIMSALSTISERLENLSDQVKAINSLWGGTNE